MFLDLDELVQQGMGGFKELVPAAMSPSLPLHTDADNLMSPEEQVLAEVGGESVPALGLYRMEDCLLAGEGLLRINGAWLASPMLMPEYWQTLLGDGIWPMPDVERLPVRQVDQLLLSFLSRDYNNYGHFWLDIAPRLFLLQRSWPRLLARCLILLPDDLASWAREALQVVFGIRPERCVTYRVGMEVLRCRSLLVPSLMHRNYAFHPAAEEFYQAVAAQCAGPALPPLPRAIYVSRRHYLATTRPASRNLLNAEEIESVMLARGIPVIAPERLSWRQQIALFSQARLVVGEHGSAMKNLLFAGAGCTAICLNYLNDTQCRIAALRGQRLIVKLPPGFSPASSGGDMRMDASALERTIDRLLASSLVAEHS